MIRHYSDLITLIFPDHTLTFMELLPYVTRHIGFSVCVGGGGARVRVCVCVYVCMYTCMFCLLA